MSDEEKFIESLYEEANEDLKEFYRQQKESRDEVLQEIAMIILAYTVLDGLMDIKKNDKDKIYKKLSVLIITNYKNISNKEVEVLNNILESTVKKTFNFYSYNADLKDVRKIIESNFKGKVFSERVWENQNEVAKRLHSQIKKFLDGKINVNQIKKDIEKTFNTSAYNAKRLVTTEVSRVSSEAFDRYCVETGVKKVRYNATLDNRLCDDCAQYHDKVYDFKNKIKTPKHPLCRCFYTIEKDNKQHIMDLQLFGIDEKKELQKLIDNGIIDGVEYNKCYEYFNRRFKYGVVTPIDTVYDKNDRFVHIARRHKYMISKKQIDNIINSLKNPDSIYKTIDKYGIEGKGYIKNIGEDELLTIVRNGIITAYYPSKNYIDKVKRGELIWERK